MINNFYKCDNCGKVYCNISGPFSPCCNTPITKLTFNTTDAATEKHVPVIELLDNAVKVTVGKINHPMTEEHYITKIYLETNKGLKEETLEPNKEPNSIFNLEEDEQIISAYAYCNLHGLWKCEL